MKHDSLCEFLRPHPGVHFERVSCHCAERAYYASCSEEEIRELWKVQGWRERPVWLPKESS